MIHFLKRIPLFCAFFIVITIIFIFIDNHVFDRVSNDYYNEVISTKKINKNIFVGSSKLKWSLIDSLLNKSTILAKPGQYAYASSTVLLNLYDKNLLKDNNIFLDLEESPEIIAGFGKWWYFSETFLINRTAHFSDYGWKDRLKIGARIYKDISHFSPNHTKVFHWTPLENLKDFQHSRAQEDTLVKIKTNFKNCKTSFSTPYRNFLIRFHKLCLEIERKTGSRVYILLPPYPESGCYDAYTSIFGNERVIDLTELKYDLSDFQDNSHLNSYGAFKLTDRVNKVLDSLNTQPITVNN